MSLLLGLLLVVVAVAGPEPIKQGSRFCRNYGGCYPHPHSYPAPQPPQPPQPDHPFLPAPPGKTPRCARPGATYCETADQYPAHLVQYLIDRWAFDFNTLLKSEVSDDFDFRYPVTYSSPASNGLLANSTPQHGYEPAQVYGPPSYPGYPGYPGYPDRRYQLDPAQTDITYPSQPQLPVSVNPSGPSGWARPGREKRQTDAGSSTLCPTTPNFVTPQAALNTQGNWMFVANVPSGGGQPGQPDRYRQLVRTETCVSSECDGLCSLPAGFSSRCSQQYVQKRLVALGGSGDRLYQDTFWFPHCCLCEITPSQDRQAG